MGPENRLRSWKPALELATMGDLEKQLLPVVLRMAKRHPNAIAVSFPSMASHITIDLSKSAKEMLDPLALDILKDKEKRRGGRCLVEQVAQKSTDLGAHWVVAGAWADSLEK